MKNKLRNQQVNFKTNAQLLEQAKEILAQKNLDLTSAFNIVLQTVVETNDFPFATEEEKIRQEIIAELQPRVQQAMENYKNGKGLSLEKVMSKYEL